MPHSSKISGATHISVFDFMLKAECGNSAIRPFWITIRMTDRPDMTIRLTRTIPTERLSCSVLYQGQSNATNIQAAVLSSQKP